MFSKLWQWIVAAFVFLFGAFLYEKNKAADANAQLDNANTNKQDATLAQHSQDVQAQINKDQAAADAEKAKPASEQDMLDFLNKNKV